MSNALSTTTPSTTTSAPAHAASRHQPATGRSLWRPGLVSGAAAAAATTVVAAIARAADIALDVRGEPIPLAGFAQLTLVGAAIGIVIAKILSTRARRPRHTFVVVTVALTALSLVPDAIADTDTASKIVLAVTHVVAAAIIIPALARRLA